MGSCTAAVAATFLLFLALAHPSNAGLFSVNRSPQAEEVATSMNTEQTVQSNAGINNQTADKAERLQALNALLGQAAALAASIAKDTQTTHSSAPGQQPSMDRINTLLKQQVSVEACPAQSYQPRLPGDIQGTIQATEPGTPVPEHRLGGNRHAFKLERQGILPKPISDMYAGQAHNEPIVRFHWVFTSCSRQQWGRTLSSTLISGLTNDLYPTSINILWCRSYNASDVPPLLYNMRHSHQVNTFYMSPELEAMNVTHVVKVLVSALLIPCALGMPNVPILYTEDDVVFAPDANARLYKALSNLPDQTLKETFALSLYNPGKIAPTPEQESGVEQPADDLSNAEKAHPATQSLVPEYWFGIQGAFFSPSLVPRLLTEYMQILDGTAANPDLWQDLLLFEFLRTKWGCNRHGSGCHYFSVRPSLVQHVGTTSAVFQHHGRNQRFHTAYDFPVRVRFPGYESHVHWR